MKTLDFRELRDLYLRYTVKIFIRVRSLILIIIGKNIRLIFKLLNIPLQKPIGLCLLIGLFLNHDLRVFCYSLTASIQKLGAKGKSALDKQIVWPGPPICPTFVTYKDFSCRQLCLCQQCVHSGNFLSCHFPGLFCLYN